MFAVRAGDAVDRAKGSDAVRHNQRTNAVDSRIRIGRVGSVELVAIPNPGRLTALFELLHEFEVVIAGNAKDVANTSFLKTTKKEVSDRHFHKRCLLCRRYPGGRCYGPKLVRLFGRISRQEICSTIDISVDICPLALAMPKQINPLILGECSLDWR